MTTDHPTREILAAYVSGAGEPAGDLQVEAHVAACAACAAALAAEARLEEALYDVAAAAAPVGRVRRSEVVGPRHRARLVAALVVGAAAAALLLVVWRAPAPVVAPPATSLAVEQDGAGPGLVFCPKSGVADACVREAQRRGLAVLNASYRVLVPRYEDTPTPGASVVLAPELVMP
jgi:hypothetical protein